MAEIAATVPGSNGHKQAQRQRILAAALERFIESGFHNASMATIAQTAGMSPGLIYRYFDSKNAIILAIIDQQLATAQCRIRDLRSTEDLCAGIVDYYDSDDNDDHESMSMPLFLEIIAESTRDPEIATALGRFDEAVRRELVDWFVRHPEQGGFGLDRAAAQQRALSLTLIIEGLRVRRAREPDLDRGLLRRTVESLLGVTPGVTPG